MTHGKVNILYLVATMMLLLAGCADTTNLGDQNGAANGTNGAIAFGGSFKAVTRADHTGAEAADELGNQFIVNAIKATNAAPDPDPRQTVFQDYTVNWITNSAGTTLTNTSNWEYAGQTHYFPVTSTPQDIKFWDWSQDYYNFAAYSVGKGNTMVVKTKAGADNNGITEGEDPAANTVFVTPFNYTNVTGWPYFLRGRKEDLFKCYITDMTTVPHANFGNVVELKFRSLAAKVRVAFYENIPGYSIKDLHFYESTGESLKTDHTGTTTTARLFGTGAFVTKGAFKIYFPKVGSANVGDPDYNRAHAGHEGAITTAAVQDFGALNYTGRERLEPEGNYYLGRTAATATFAGDAEDNYYTLILPYEATTKTIELRVNYTLVSTDITGETINVYGAHAIIPPVYTIWKPNCAYTYIFKINDNQNGWTTTNTDESAGLFPITFDAAYLNDENGQQTTITTVAEPSITTYQKGHEYDGTNTYALPTASTSDDDDIYAQVMDVESKTLKADLNVANKSYFYGVNKADPGDPEPTESQVMDALNIPASESAGTIVGANGLTLTPSTIDNSVTSIPGATGAIPVDAGKAAKLTPAAAGTYAYVYDTGTYYPITSVYLTSAPTGWPASYYTDAACNTPATTFSEGTYYQKLKVYGVKGRKVRE